ncbi:hypothetical protein D3C73_1571480 [compost metagenome]
MRNKLSGVTPAGEAFRTEYEVTKHPVRASQIRYWLDRHGFAIERFFGDRKGGEYTHKSSRAIFWARK